jgi:hypothetical protein
MDLLQQLQAEGVSEATLERVSSALERLERFDRQRQYAARIASRTEFNLCRVPKAIERGVLDYAVQQVNKVIDDNAKLMLSLGLIE